MYYPLRSLLLLLTHLLQKIMLAVVISWSVCWLLTGHGLLDVDSPARTDAAASLMHSTPWIRVPYPCKAEG